MMRYCTLYVYMTHEKRRRRRQIDRRNRFQNTITYAHWTKLVTRRARVHGRHGW